METPNSKMNILVADDHPTNQMVLQHNLEKHPHRVTIASNGQEVLTFCDGETFDLILMDVQMPFMDGIEATERLRRGNGPNREVPIVAVTASSEKSVRDRCLAAGMNDVVTKPLLFTRLVEILDRWQGHRGEALPSGADSPESDDGIRAALSNVVLRETIPGAPPVDYDMLVQRLDGDRGFAKVLLDGFCSQTETILKEMNVALREADLETLGRAAHMVKGGALNIVAGDLRSAAESLEETAKQQGGDAALLLSQVETAFDRLKTYLKETFE